jgi:hypothetical protein
MKQSLLVFFLIFLLFFLLKKNIIQNFTNNNQDATILINSVNPLKSDLTRSIFGCLNQKGVNVKVIVVTIEGDETINIVNQIKNKNLDLLVIDKNKHPGKGPRGIYYQINEGLKKINTRYYSYFSSNDEIYPTKIMNEIKNIVNDDSIACFSNFLITHNGGKTVKHQKKPIINKKNLIKGCFINDCATIDLIKYKDRKKKNLYFDYMKYSNDCYYELWLDLVCNLGNNSISYNDNIEWHYIRDENKSQSLQTKKNEKKMREKLRVRNILLNKYK